VQVGKVLETYNLLFCTLKFHWFDSQMGVSKRKIACDNQASRDDDSCGVFVMKVLLFHLHNTYMHLYSWWSLQSASYSTETQWWTLSMHWEHGHSIARCSVQVYWYIYTKIIILNCTIFRVTSKLLLGLWACAIYQWRWRGQLDKKLLVLALHVHGVYINDQIYR